MKYNTSKLLLNVPYAEKDEAKRLGARWNPELKKWYVSNKADYYKFRKWISSSDNFYIVTDFLYIVEGIRTCFKCHKPTRVICFGIENYFDYFSHYKYAVTKENEWCYNEDKVVIIPHIDPIPDNILEYIQEHYNYKMTYSKTIQSSYMANCCDNCGTLQGDFFLFHEVDSPFFIEDAESASKINLYRIPLKYDLILEDLDIGFGPEMYLLKKYAQIIDLNQNYNIKNIYTESSHIPNNVIFYNEIHITENTLVYNYNKYNEDTKIFDEMPPDVIAPLDVNKTTETSQKSFKIYSSTLGTVSMILGILSILFCCCGWLNILLGLASIITGIIQIANSYFGQVQAVIGIITGIIGIFIGIIVIIYFVEYSTYGNLNLMLTK